MVVRQGGGVPGARPFHAAFGPGIPPKQTGNFYGGTRGGTLSGRNSLGDPEGWALRLGPNPHIFENPQLQNWRKTPIFFALTLTASPPP